MSEGAGPLAVILTHFSKLPTENVKTFKAKISFAFFTEIISACHLSVQLGGRRCSMASPNLKRPLSSRPRQRGSPKTSKIRELDRGQIVFVFSVEVIVTLELASSATLDAVPYSEDVIIVSRD